LFTVLLSDNVSLSFYSFHHIFITIQRIALNIISSDKQYFTSSLVDGVYK